MTSRSLGGLVLALAVSALAVWAFLAGNSAPGQEADPSRAPVASASAVDPEELAPAEDSPSVGGESTRESESSQPSKRQLATGTGLTVRVLDAGSDPLQGVRVELLRNDFGIDVVAAQETDERGQAHFDQPRDPNFLWYVDVDALVAASVRTEIEPDSGSREVVLTLPPVGSVEVRAFETTGRVALGEFDVSLGLVLPGQERQLGAVDRDQRPLLWRELVDGVATFPRVEIGFELEVGVRRPGGRVATTVFEPGPGVANQRVVVQLAHGSFHPVLRARLVDAQYVPLANEIVSAGVQYSPVEPSARGGSWWSWSERVRTDEEGFLVIDVGRSKGGETDKLFVVERQREDLSPDVGSLALDKPLDNAVHDLGTVVVGPAPLLVGGEVVDGLGKPIEGAYVMLGRGFTEQTDAVGRFEFRGAPVLGEVRVSAWKENYGRVEVGVDESKDVRIVLPATGTVVGSFRSLDRSAASALRLTLRAESGIVHHGVFPSSGGDFVFRSVPVGTYEFAVARRFGDEPRTPLLELERITVVADDETRDPRMTDIVLGANVHPIAIELIAPGSEKLDVTLVYGPAGGGGKPFRRSSKEREFTLVSPAPVIDVEVAAEGFLVASRRDISVKASIELVRSGESMLVHVQASGQRPAAPNTLLVGLSRLGERTEPVELDGSGGAIVRVTEPGQHRVIWYVRERTETRSRSARSSEQRTAELPIDEPQIVVVADSATQESIEVVVPTADVEAYLGR